MTAKQREFHRHRAYLIALFAFCLVGENVADALDGDWFAWVLVAMFAVTTVGWGWLGWTERERA